MDSIQNQNEVKDVCGMKFRGFGSNESDYQHAYMSMTCAKMEIQQTSPSSQQLQQQQPKNNTNKTTKNTKERKKKNGCHSWSVLYGCEIVFETNGSDIESIEEI